MSGSPINFLMHQIRAGNIAGARDDFEDMITQLVRCAYPSVRRVQANPGDWGIDCFVGELDGEIVVWQAKYFIDGVGESQKGEIRESFKSAREKAREEGYQVSSWIVCIPVDLDAPTTKWWQKWKKDQLRDHGIPVDMWTASELEGLLISPDASNVRDEFYTVGPPVAHSLSELPWIPLPNPGDFDSALFVKQLQEAGMVELGASKEQYFNADLMACDVHNKGVRTIKVFARKKTPWPMLMPRFTTFGPLSLILPVEPATRSCTLFTIG